MLFIHKPCQTFCGQKKQEYGKVFDEFRGVIGMHLYQAIFLYLRGMLIERRILLFLVLLACAGASTAGVSIIDDSAKVSLPKPKGGFLDKPIDYTADDSIIFDIKKNKVYLYRNAELHYGDINLTAYYIEVDMNRKEIFAKGGLDSNGKYGSLPVLTDGGDTYKADSMRYNSGSKKGRVYGLRLTQDEAVIHLSTVLKNEDGSFVGDRGKITTCTDDHPHFYFNANRIKVIPNNKVLFGSANLVVADVPTPLAVPFGLAPLKKGRRNGILFPSYGYNYSNKSFYLQKLGYYTGLGPYADLTISTDMYLNGDLRGGVSSNFVKKYKYRGGITLTASRFGNGQERTSPYYDHNLDYSLITNFAFDPKYLPGTVLNGDIHVQTGNFNRLNSRDLSSIAQNQYNSSINYGHNFLKNKITLNASARHSQNTQTHQFRMELPNIAVGVPRITPFANLGSDKWYAQIGFSYNMNFSNILNTIDTILFSTRGKDEFKNLQNGITHALSGSTTFKLLKGTINLSPSINYNEKWYFNTIRKSWDVANKKEVVEEVQEFSRLQDYNAAATLSTNIYGMYKDLNLGKLRAIRHTITPSVSIGYSPEVNPVKKNWIRGYFNDTLKYNNLIKYNIYEKGINGSYNHGESGSVGFSINNNLQAKKSIGKKFNGGDSVKKVNLIDALNFSGSYNMLADSLKFSDLNAQLNTVLLDMLNINMSAAFSPYAINTKGIVYNTFQYKLNNSPLRFSNFHTSINTRLTPDLFKSKLKKPAPENPKSGTAEELEDVRRNGEKYYNFNIPWTLTLSYIFDYNKVFAIQNPGKDAITTNRIAFSGDVNITPEWKVGYSSGYDMVRKEIVSSQFTVSRNLHCWQLDFSWIPSGYGKMWVFTLRPKSGLLQDLKLNKRVYPNNPALFGAY